MAQGAAALSEAELLTVLLRTGSRGKTAVEVARTLPQSSGGLGGLFRAPEELRARGLGPAKRSLLGAVLEVARRCLPHARTISRQRPPCTG